MPLLGLSQANCLSKVWRFSTAALRSVAARRQCTRERLVPLAAPEMGLAIGERARVPLLYLSAKTCRNIELECASWSAPASLKARLARNENELALIWWLRSRSSRSLSLGAHKSSASCLTARAALKCALTSCDARGRAHSFTRNCLRFANNLQALWRSL